MCNFIPSQQRRQFHIHAIVAAKNKPKFSLHFNIYCVSSLARTTTYLYHSIFKQMTNMMRFFIWSFICTWLIQIQKTASWSVRCILVYLDYWTMPTREWCKELTESYRSDTSETSFTTCHVNVFLPKKKHRRGDIQKSTEHVEEMVRESTSITFHYCALIRERPR